MAKVEHHQPTFKTVDPRSVLVAIPTFNEEPFIEATLEMILADDPAMRDVSVVVSDGGSSDRTREIVTAYAKKNANVSLIDNPRRKQSAGVNHVVEHFARPQHEILVRVDAHADYPPNYVLDVANALIEHDAAAVATVMDATGENCFQRGAAWAVDSNLGSGGSGHRGGVTSGYVDHGHHAGFRIDMWRQTGGYDPDYGANQDAELDHRIRQNGGLIWLDADIRIGYHMRPTPAKLARQYWLYGRGRARTLFRHRSIPRLRQLIPPTVVLACFLGLALGAIFPGLLLVPMFYLALIFGASLVVAVNQTSLCGLWSGPALAIMHLCWGAGFLWQAATRQARAP